MQAEKSVGEVLQSIKAAGFHVRKAEDSGRREDAVQFAASMVGELRAGHFSPREYFELFMAASDELRALLVHWQPLIGLNHASVRSDPAQLNPRSSSNSSMNDTHTGKTKEM